MNKSTYLLAYITILVLSIFGCQSPSNSNAKSSIDQKVDSLLSIMTLEEKVGQMNQYSGFYDVTGPSPKEGQAANKYKHLEQGLVGSMLNVKGVKKVRAFQKIAVENTRLGIPLIFGFDVIHGHKTLSPIPLAESASWDLEAIENSARNAAIEASAQGINWTFAPMVDISRDARWGRVMEGAGEDTYLGSLIAKARVNGFQGEDLSLNNTIAACAKHFAAYGFVEAGKEYNSVDIGTSTLYNVVLPPFKAATDAGVKTVMNSFNQLNGIPATGDNFLQRDILKSQWEFDGFIISDWGSITEMQQHGFAKDLEDAAKKASIAGNDMDMESYAYVNHLVDLVKNGDVEESVINEAAGRILKVKFELGLFEDPYRYCNLEHEKEIVGSKKLHDDALDMAKKSIVLLKNDNAVLPLKKEGLNIAVIGELANDKTSPLGSWRLAAEDNTAISVIEGLSEYARNKVTYSSGPVVFEGSQHFIKEVPVNTTDRSGFNEAVETAKNKDVVIMVLGEHGFQSGESRSRTNIDLPGLQQELLEAVYKVNKNVVLVLMNGRPLAINWADEHIPSIVEAWQLGTQSGNAIAQVLYGDYNPSGKLTMTFPKNIGQIPMYYNHKSTGRPINKENNVFWSHYSDVDNEPLYPFGHGLSYASFAYSNLKLSKTEANIGEDIEVLVNLTNTSNVAGKEVVQLYIRDLFGSVARPVKELKGFEMVPLNAGETKTISFILNNDSLGFFDNSGKFIIESGDFKVFIGGSSKTALEADFTLM